MTLINHFGLHFAPGDVGFLHQKGPTQSLYPGLASPFQVRLTRKRPRSCPHAVDLAVASSRGRELLEDPLARWFAAPSGVAYLHDPLQDAVPACTWLAQLYSPARPLVDMAWTTRSHGVWQEEANITNLAPWVLVGVGSPDLDRVHAFLTGAFPRPLLVLAREIIPKLPGMTVLSTDLRPSDQTMRLEPLGAWAITQRMKKAPLL